MATRTTLSSRLPAGAGGEALRRLTRLMRLLVHVQGPGRYTLAALAEEFGCSVKTIQRDLRAMEEMGIPVEWDRERRSYRLFGPLPFALLDVGLAEATALALAEAASVAAQGLSVDESLSSAFQKVHRLIPPEMAASLEASRQALVGAGGAKKDYSSAPLLPLVSACRDRAAIRIDYTSLASGRRWREVHPYCVACLEDFWMLIAWDPVRKDVRTFALDRIHDFAWVEPRRCFTPPKGWNLTAYMAGSVGVLRGAPVDVRLRFDATVAPAVVGRKWRFPHALEQGTDGTVTLCGTVAGLDEIAAEVLRWGRHITVEAPEALRRRIADDARAIAAKYEG